MADHDLHPSNFNGRSMIPQGTQENGVPFGHEESDVNVRTTLVAVVVLLSSVLVVMLAMAGMFSYLHNREKLKDKETPALFSRRVDPPKPWLYPSVQQDRTLPGADKENANRGQSVPWAVYQQERREQDAAAAKIGVMDLKSGAYTIPNAGNAVAAQQKYFAAKHQWESADSKYAGDASGGRIMTGATQSDVEGAKLNRPMDETTFSTPPPPVRSSDLNGAPSAPSAPPVGEAPHTGH